MDDASGIRAGRWRRRGMATLVLAVLAVGVAGPSAAGGGGGHGEPAPAPAAPPPPAKPEPPPKKKLDPVTRVEVPRRVPRQPADSLTGLALAGYDPVAYVVDRAAREGKPDFEYEWRGAVWRFANEGNLAAFVDAPTVYAPRYAGFCAFQMSRGYAAEADPTQFAVHGGRLYLFATAAHRAAFLSDPAAAVAEAEKRWEEVSLDLP